MSCRALERSVALDEHDFKARRQNLLAHHFGKLVHHFGDSAQLRTEVHRYGVFAVVRSKGVAAGDGEDDGRPAQHDRDELADGVSF